MQISDQKVVSIEYTLTADDGSIIDSSEGGAPLAYIHGMGNIIPGLEKELDGKSVGDELKVHVVADEAYGEKNAELIQSVAREQFQGVDDLEVGMQFQSMNDDQVIIVTVIGIEDNVVVVDGNHPLAGMDLNFDVKVVDIRDATAEELDHGHVHEHGESCEH